MRGTDGVQAVPGVRYEVREYADEFAKEYRVLATGVTDAQGRAAVPPPPQVSDDFSERPVQVLVADTPGAPTTLVTRAE